MFLRKHIATCELPERGGGDPSPTLDPLNKILASKLIPSKHIKVGHLDQAAKRHSNDGQLGMRFG